MIVIVLLLAVSLIVAVGFLVAFIWSAKSGQFDDSFSPANKILFDNNQEPINKNQ
ncbi:MAG TPA: cbb3-type cytochrome oxidase assembly protein CcoS [Sediminibacterium sp.]|nr:cbb3-type cytochrome oxidase assembly protein CcoS [Sediminibacterium sp.]